MLQELQIGGTRLENAYRFNTVPQSIKVWFSSGDMVLLCRYGAARTH
jgi:hypothetical protein